jgi:uncharacterized sulfatase
MQRREFLSSMAGAAAAGAPSGRPPNIVVILADDLGYGDLGCFGSRRNRTPVLDRMASSGVRFTDFYVPVPYCAPSRATLLTGRYPFRHGLTRNPAPDAGINDAGLAASEITLAEALRERGYATTCIGKWHLGHTPEFLPRKQGFDEYYGILYSNDMRPVQVVHNEEVVEYPVVQSKLTRDYTDRAIRFVESNRQRPFFLYLPHAMPHKPLAASEEFYTPDTPGDLYSDVIRELDASVGRLLERISALGLERETLVVFTSDNGPYFGGETPFRGMKARTWEGGLRVPMIARWPGRIPEGLVSREPCGNWDLFPTICSLAGAGLPRDREIDGRDILPLMTTAGARSPHEAVFGMQGERLATVRSGRWKLSVLSPGASSSIANPAANWKDPRGPDGVTLVAPYEQANPGMYPGVEGGDAAKPMMLFDLEADPREQRDVAAANPEVVQRLRGLFDAMERNVKPAPPARPAERRLRRLTGGALRYDVETIRPEPRP